MLAAAGALASSPQTLSGYTVTNVFPSLSSTGLRAGSVTCRQPDTAGRRTTKSHRELGNMWKRSKGFYKEPVVCPVQSLLVSGGWL